MSRQALALRTVNVRHKRVACERRDKKDRDKQNRIQRKREEDHDRRRFRAAELAAREFEALRLLEAEPVRKRAIYAAMLASIPDVDTTLREIYRRNHPEG